MRKFVIHTIVGGIALIVALYLLRGHGINFEETNWVSLVILALIFGLVNAIIKPIVQALTCPLIILTLGLGTLLINTAMFFLTGWIGTQFNVGFTVEGFWPAFLGALIVSVVSFLLGIVIH